MAGDDRLPGLGETLRIQLAVDTVAVLHVVQARARLEQGVQQHAFLHRRQRVDVLDLPGRHRQVVQLRLGQFRQREVRRRQAARLVRQAMLDQALQLVEVPAGGLKAQKVSDKEVQMAEKLVEAIRRTLGNRVKFSEVRMFGGTGFLLGGNIFVGTSKQGLLVRVGKEAHHQAVRQTGVKAMTMGGRVSQGFVFVDPKVLDAPALKSWVSSAVEAPMPWMAMGSTSVLPMAKRGFSEA